MKDATLEFGASVCGADEAGGTLRVAPVQHRHRGGLDPGLADALGHRLQDIVREATVIRRRAHHQHLRLHLLHFLPFQHHISLPSILLQQLGSFPSIPLRHVLPQPRRHRIGQRRFYRGQQTVILSEVILTEPRRTPCQYYRFSHRFPQILPITAITAAKITS